MYALVGAHVAVGKGGGGLVAAPDVHVWAGLSAAAIRLVDARLLRVVATCRQIQFLLSLPEGLAASPLDGE